MDREQTIQTLEDIMRGCILDFKGSWDDHLPLIEFAYNNSCHFKKKKNLFKKNFSFGSGPFRLFKNKFSLKKFPSKKNSPQKK